jgi:FMN phosphatase YigB (HAD superfamily)
LVSRSKLNPVERAAAIALPVTIALLYFPFKTMLVFLRLAKSRKSQSRREASYANDSAIWNLVDRHEVISFDAFDTLILRNVRTPAGIFEIIEQQSHEHDFTKNRLRAERNANKVAARLGRVGVNLDEIYRNLQSAASERTQLMEIGYQLDFCVRNPFLKMVYDYARARGKRIVIASDIYFTEGQMKSILNKCGYDHFERLFLSSPGRYSKSQGGTYRAMCVELAVDPRKVLHIGDDKNSDCLMAHRAGVDCFLYTQMRERYPRFFKTRDVVFETIHNGLINTSLSEQHSYFFELGSSILGPLCLSLVHWIKDRTEEDKVEAVYFLSRDGYIVRKVCDEMFSIKTSYACVSRLVLKRALLSLKGIDPSKIFTDELNGNSLNFVLRALIPEFKDDDIAGTLFEGSRIESESLGAYPQLIAMLQDRYGEYLDSQHDSLLEYLSSIGMTRQRRVGVFDVGWNGRIQESLQILFAANGIHTAITGYYIGIHDNAINLERSRRQRMRGFVFFLKRPPINVYLFENLFVAPHGTVVGYARKIDEIIPLFDSDPDEMKNYPKYRDLEDGVLWYVKEVCKYRNLIENPPDVGECLRAMNQLTNAPGCLDLEQISTLVHTTVFAGGFKTADDFWPSAALDRRLLKMMGTQIGHESRIV